MNEDEPGSRDLTPADIRALLAGARHHEPVPDDVAASLDVTLAGLVAARAAAENVPASAEPATVVELADRRRLRRGRRLLVAAAAVVIAGAGGTAIVHTLQGNGADRQTSATRANDAVTPQVGTSQGRSPAPEHVPLSATAGGTMDLAADLPRFSASDFKNQAARYVRLQKTLYSPGALVNGTNGQYGSLAPDGDVPAPGGPAGEATPRSTTGQGGTGGQGSTDNQGSTDSQGSTGGQGGAVKGTAPVPPGGPDAGPTPAPGTCEGPANEFGTPIEYDGEPAVLVITPAAHGTRVVAYTCAGTVLQAVLVDG